MTSDLGRWRRIYASEWHAGPFQSLSDGERVAYFYISAHLGAALAAATSEAEVRRLLDDAIDRALHATADRLAAEGENS